MPILHLDVINIAEEELATRSYGEKQCRKHDGNVVFLFVSSSQHRSDVLVCHFILVSTMERQLQWMLKSHASCMSLSVLIVLSNLSQS